jgi:hypothetical protein
MREAQQFQRLDAMKSGGKADSAPCVLARGSREFTAMLARESSQRCADVNDKRGWWIVYKVGFQKFEEQS